MDITYINLAARPDRDERFRRLNAGVGMLHRADAVVGSHLTVEDLVRGGVIVGPLAAFTAGALGNAVSHKRLWERCAAGDGVLTVAEDDAVFNRQFPELALQVLAGLPADWDLILWGWNFDSLLHVRVFDGLKDAVMYFDPQLLGPGMATFQAAEFPVVALPLVNAFGIASYSVSPAGARRLLAVCFPLTDEPVPIPGLKRVVTNFSLDATLNRHYGDLRAFACFPPLVWTENDKAASDVGAGIAADSVLAGPLSGGSGRAKI